MDGEQERPYTKDEVLHGIALIQAHLAEDTDAITVLHGDEEDPKAAFEIARAMFALTHIIVYGAIVPQMWVIKKDFSYGHTNNVPELSLALLMVERVEHRLELADTHPVVNALSMGDVMGLIVRCAGTDMDDVPEFLDSVRERTLRSMPS
ncbi:DUF6224 family protein [Streptomyces sp. DT24]|uniref:DUF6224 family protein n=1 Tax=unclassified Streptomyces TaxID=2593676 RepID=UPI0023B9C75B|nr:DUF6224 family protein [Streptomyces sp. AM 4-1-1]WEH33171.1 hypothetical protein PZB75_07130 [Streptomyces sp. AM 4-1-1]